MLQLTRAAVTIDHASGIDCNIGNHFLADEFRPLEGGQNMSSLDTYFKVKFNVGDS